jgi:peptidoglycan/LPS O-acetylase OafA/YrhL
MTPQAARQDPTSLWRNVWRSLAVLVALVLAHDVDHVFNQDQTGNLPLGFWLFVPFQYGVFGAVLALVGRRDPRAPALAALLSGVTFLGFIGAHLVPGGPLPYADYDLPAISWLLVFVPMAAALLALAAALRLRAALGAVTRPAASPSG